MSAIEITHAIVGVLVVAYSVIMLARAIGMGRLESSRELDRAVSSLEAEADRAERKHSQYQDPAPMILTADGVFIPDLSTRERQLLRETPEQWAEQAANRVHRSASRAYAYGPAGRSRGLPDPSWRSERAQLVADGHEQWLLWMERNPGDDAPGQAHHDCMDGRCKPRPAKEGDR